MKSLDCPHCFTSVLVTASNLCPHCGKNVLDASGTKQSIRKLIVKDGQTLPDCCLHCGTNTTRRVTVKRYSGGMQRGTPTILAWVVGFIFAPFGALRVLHHESKVGPEQKKLTVDIPQCLECASKRRAEPHEVDFETYQMTFLVHIDLYKAANTGQVSS